jgi:pSer/pThr/pTyr-binding forkhead associated (FHA) protein
MSPSILSSVSSVTGTAVLSPLTPLCASKFSEGFFTLEIQDFPFRIGRDEGNGHDYLPSGTQNNLCVHDDEPFQVSRKHCFIEKEGDLFFVRDNGSSLGTIVNGVPIGVRQISLSEALKPGENTLMLGTARSSFKFLVEIL